jgi:hypothetical protein
MKKKIFTMGLLVMLVGVTACTKTEVPTNEPDVVEEAVVEEEVVEEFDLADSLLINFCMGNNARTMTYQQANPLTLPDGTIVTQGDLKPTWQYISEQLGFEIVDTAVQDQKASEMIDLQAATGFADATIYGGNSIAEDLMNYGAQGYFINLKDYLQYMPNFSAYLEEKPNVAKAITAYDGGIYHIPYVAEIDNYARTFNARNSWVEALLDSTDQLETESSTLEVAYTSYWDRNATNVIDLQNEAASDGKLTQEAALTTLVNYITETYPEYTNPSELYVGVNAQYDIDELVALWRVIELSPNTLSKVTTGAVVADAEISPYFVRKADYREDTLRLLNYFDGEKVHASDSYGAQLYVDENGEMHYSYADPEFLEKMDYLKAMYSEGLIHSEFSDLSITDEFRKSMYFADDAEGQRQFGFMTFDWIASTTGSNDDINVFLPPVTTLSEAGITDYIHYIENTRVIKPDGWSISSAASETDIHTALALFDYMFSEEGNIVQNYSTPDALVEGETFLGPDGIEYPTFNQWLLDTADEMKNGDVSGFLRDFMGSQLSLGYQKEIGFEYQYTSQNGFDGWDMYNTADVLTMSYEADNVLLRLMPPIISLNDQELAQLNEIAVGEDQTDALFLYITGSESALGSVEEIEQMFIDAGIEKYLEVYEGAYNRMIE